MSNHVETVNKCDAIVQRFLSDIRKGVYQSGERLPSETELGKKFGVSRVTIRESFKKLSSMNVVRIRQGEGTFVNSFAPENYLQPLFPMLIFDQATITELMEARLYIERATVELAIQKATDTEVLQLESILNDMDEYLERNAADNYIRADIQFHLHIADMSQNKVLMRTLDTIEKLLDTCISRLTDRCACIATSHQWHGQLLDAIKKRDTEQASKFITIHLKDAQDALVSRLRMER